MIQYSPKNNFKYYGRMVDCSPNRYEYHPRKKIMILSMKDAKILDVNTIIVCHFLIYS